MDVPAPPVIALCRACGAALSRPVTALEVEATPLQAVEGKDALPAGWFWRARPGLEEPWCARAGDLFLCREDLAYAVPCGTRNGCCGPDGLDGPNLACPCGVPVATECGDCWQTHYVLVLHERVGLLPADAPPADVRVFAPDPLRVTAWELAAWLHAALGVDDWFGDDLGAIVAAWASRAPAPLVIVWRDAHVSAAARVPVEALAARLQVEGAPLRVVLG